MTHLFTFLDGGVSSLEEREFTLSFHACKVCVKAREGQKQTKTGKAITSTWSKGSFQRRVFWYQMGKGVGARWRRLTVAPTDPCDVRDLQQGIQVEVRTNHTTAFVEILLVPAFWVSIFFDSHLVSSVHQNARLRIRSIFFTGRRFHNMEGNNLCKQCDTRHVRSLSSSGFVATWATLRTKKTHRGSTRPAVPWTGRAMATAANRGPWSR